MEVLTLENGKRLLTNNGRIIADRDLEIIKALADGENMKTIGAILNISSRTVEAKIDKLRLMFNAKTRPQLVSIAKDLKLI
jgi:DNA-binding CsgD family transcriptional regulator